MPKWPFKFFFSSSIGDSSLKLQYLQNFHLIVIVVKWRIMPQCAWINILRDVILKERLALKMWRFWHFELGIVTKTIKRNCPKYLVPGNYTIGLQYSISSSFAWTETDAHADDSNNVNKDPQIDFWIKDWNLPFNYVIQLITNICLPIKAYMESRVRLDTREQGFLIFSSGF